MRGGADNAEVLTTFTGTVPGDAMKKVIPSSSGDAFDAEYLVTDDGELRQAVLTGVFYKNSEEMTYTVDLADYGTSRTSSLHETAAGPTRPGRLRPGRCWGWRPSRWPSPPPTPTSWCWPCPT